jgi:formate hydrogenlyase subunit 4
MVSYSLSLFIICCLRICTMYWNIHKIFGKLESTTLETLKLYIYIIYFGIFTMINLTSILISSFIDQGLSIFTVHMINLVFYFILTCLLFLLVFKIVTVKRVR